MTVSPKLSTNMFCADNFKRITLIAAWLIFFASTAQAQVNADELKEIYSLERHSEGGFFAEMYTSPFVCDGRPTAGSIYFLLEGDDVSHFHQIDCDEIWYYHAGCGMKIISLRDGFVEEILLGVDPKLNQRPMVVVPAGTIFAAENLDKNDFTFISCATTPRFTYEGFRLVTRSELKKLYPRLPANILQMAYEKIPTS